MKRISRTLLFVLLLFAGTPALAAEPDVPESTGTFVQDHAQVLTADQTSQIESMATQLEQATEAQIVILTIPNAIEVPEMYGVEAFRKFGIGSGEDNNGVLLLVSTVPNSSGDR
ncbi:MAG: TPM domain-containing protein, partial [Bhargavaea sp.]